MWKEILYVGAGSFVGGALRYVVSLILKYDGGFPWATFTVNLIGCLLIGVLWGLFCRVPNVSQNLVLFLSVGLCGGFTTFSTFSKESLNLLQSGNYTAFCLYAFGSVAIGILAVAVGFAVVVGGEAEVLFHIFSEEREVVKSHLVGDLLDAQVAVK